MTDKIPERLKFATWAEWDVEMRERKERQDERDRADPILTRIKAWADALHEEARLVEIESEEEVKRAEEEAKRERSEEVRIALHAILEEDATSSAMRRALIERVRPKPTKADDQARAAEINRLVPIVKEANLLTGRKLSITDACVDRIRPHLPKEEQRATYVMLKDAIREAKRRRIEMPL
jgi:hypothetical protein